MTFQTYEFGAFKETDLTADGKTNFFVGSSIVMADQPSVTISVSDDDAFLSGDGYTSELADDQSGQEASIFDENGNDIGNGGQIYGEVFYWVSDEFGNTYRLVEIEQEDGSGDYFAFTTDYGIPAAGTALTVDQKVNIKDNTLIPDYASLGATVVNPDPDPEPEPAPDFQITAFNEFDLVTQPGKKNMFVGDTIVLPAGPTVLISVQDDDSILSGDNIANEYSDDESGQFATVTDLNGQEVGNGGQIFGECYYWVIDAQGNRYQMVEIEQEDSVDDYFAFYSEFGMPEAGVELYVERKVNVKDKTIVLNYADLSAGEMYDTTVPEADVFMF